MPSPFLTLTLTRLRLTTLALLAAVLATGCQATAPGRPGASGGPILQTRNDLLSVQQLAGRLGLGVREQTRVVTTLTDGANTVVVYPDPGGRVFVNGQPVGQPGGIARIDGIVFVPEGMESAVRHALRSSPAPRPQPHTPQTPRGPVSGRVVLDPGHGGRDPGAIGVYGDFEKTVNLAVAQETARLLRERGMTVHLTRTTDTFIELDDRPAVARRADADLFVSIHADSCDRPRVRGFTVYVARQASTRTSLAAADVERRLRATGVTSRGIRQANFRVLVGSQAPAMLVELGYLSNPTESRQLASHEHQGRLARALAEGIAEALSAQ